MFGDNREQDTIFFNLIKTNHVIPKQVLTERLDAILLEKAETEQQCLCLKKENIKMKQEVEVRQHLVVFYLLYRITQNSNEFAAEWYLKHLI